MASYIAVRLRRAEGAQKRANELLREKDRIKDEYVAHVSHDIKGHLAAIQSCLNVAVTEPLQGQAAEFVDRAYRRTRTLTSFVRMLLRLTQLKLDGNSEREQFSVSEAIQEALESVRFAAREKSLQLECSLGPAEAVVSGSEFSFREAITNLLLNAVKYTPDQGAVSIGTQLREQSVVIEISDTGIGIPKDEQARIFNEFYRASNAIKMDAHGDGLGLALVKEVVELHGGTIELSSNLGCGTTFRIVLPLAAVAGVGPG
jgi:signal transduction histidine kinase